MTSRFHIPWSAVLHFLILLIVAAIITVALKSGHCVQPRKSVAAPYNFMPDEREPETYTSPLHTCHNAPRTAPGMHPSCVPTHDTQPDGLFLGDALVSLFDSSQGEAIRAGEAHKLQTIGSISLTGESEPQGVVALSGHSHPSSVCMVLGHRMGTLVRLGGRLHFSLREARGELAA